MDNLAFNGEDAERNWETRANGQPQGLEIKRKLNLLSGTALIVGRMIGTGIFITPGGVLQRAGSVGLALIIWFVSGIISILGSFAYAELGTMMPKSGGDFAYFVDTLGPLHPFWGPLPAFFFSWISTLIMRPVAIAVGCLTIAKYTVHPMWVVLGLCSYETKSKEILLKITALLYLWTMTCINCYSTSWALRASNFFTFAKLTAILILIGCGVYQLAQGNTQHLATGFEGTTQSAGTIALAFYGVLFSYDGWRSLNHVVEELKNPLVNLPRALLIGLPTVMVCYVFVNVAYLTVLSPEELVSSEAVAVDVANRMLGPVAFLIPVGVALSAIGTTISNSFVAARMFFASAREGHFLSVLSYVHIDGRNPTAALIAIAGLSTIAILIQDVGNLIQFMMFIIWIFYVFIMIIIIFIRKTRPNVHRPFKVSLAVPIFLILVGCFLVITPLVSSPSLEILYVISAALLTGLFVYIPFVHYKYSFRCTAHLTRAVQLILKIGPPAKPVLD